MAWSTLGEVRDRLGATPGGSKWVGRPSGGRNGLGDTPGGPEWVRRPSGRSGTFWETLLEA